MDIAVIGAGGSVGRAIVQMIVSERLLACDQRLVLVGNAKGASASSLPGYAVDLMDAYAEITPQIDVVLAPEEINADIIVMAGGATVPIDQKGGPVSRDFLATNNLPIFERYAVALAKHGHGHEIVICISNPNELAVAVFAKHLGRKRVVGMGAFLDSLRFRKEIALDLGVRRQRIHGFMLGEHGANTVPLWSSVHVYGYDEAELQKALKRARRGRQTEDFPSDVAQAQREVRKLIAEGKIQEAYCFVDLYPPGVRVVLKPFVTHFSRAKTAVGTAATTMELLRTITLGHDALIAGQIVIEGEFYGIHGTLGVPFVVGNRGVERVIEIPVTEDEKELLMQIAQSIRQKIEALL
jgi:malate dehydrogenase